MNFKGLEEFKPSLTAEITLKTALKEYINKNKKVYLGNLRLWIKNDYPEINDTNINLALLQLRREGYFIDMDGNIYAHDKSISHLKLLAKLVSKTNLSKLDYDIMESIQLINDKNLLKGRKPHLRNISELILSRCVDYDAKSVKYRISVLFLMKLLIITPSNENPESLEVNWDVIKEVCD